MKKYSFLFKPLFFICSLIFATWLVFYIEKIKPSDFNAYDETGKAVPKTELVIERQQRERLKKICNDYKAGIIDSAELDKELKEFIKTSKQ